MEMNVIVPQLGESIVEGILTKWFKKVGDVIQKDDALFEISTDKIDSEIPSSASGTLLKLLVKEGATVAVNSVVAIIETAVTPKGDSFIPMATHVPSEEDSMRDAPASTSSFPKTTTTVEKISPMTIRSSPLARKIARHNSIDLLTVSDRRTGSRITKQDIVDVMSSGQPASGLLVRTSVQSSSEMLERREPMNIMQRAIAEHMLTSKRTSPHVTTVFEVDMNAVARSRESRGERFKAQEGFPLTDLPYIAYATVKAIDRHPIINASISGSEILYKDYIHLGMAVALEGSGLIVPVIKKAGQKSFVQIARLIQKLTVAAHHKKLAPDDVRGGSFTIINPGIFGCLFETPIINQPQTAILSAGAVTKRVVVIDDTATIRPMMFLSLSFDHRSIDGARADPFMADVKEMLEKWTDEE